MKMQTYFLGKKITNAEFCFLLQAEIKLKLIGLLKLLSLPQYRWMHERALRLWRDWVTAGKRFKNEKHKWKKKKVNKFVNNQLYSFSANVLP